MAKTEERKGSSNNGLSCNTIQFPFTVNIRFPGDLDYIPAVRKFIAEILQVSNFDSKFAYRSEIIVDELCTNAVVYGCRNDAAEVKLGSTVFEDHIEFTIQDQGGTKDHLRRLKSAVKRRDDIKSESVREEGLGLEIVRMLSERLEVVIDEHDVTSIHVTRKREDERKNSNIAS